MLYTKRRSFSQYSIFPFRKPKQKFHSQDKKTLIVISSSLKRNGVVAYTCKYGGNRCWTSLLLYHGGEFTKFPGRKYIKGKQTYVDLLDMDTFSVYLCTITLNDLFSDLDFELFALGSDQDVRHLGTFISKHKLIEVYIEHGKTRLHTYTMSPNQSKIQIKKISEAPTCSQANVMDLTGNDNMDLTVIDNGDNNKEENPCVEFEIGDIFEQTNEVEFGDGNKDKEDPWAEFESGHKFEDINEDEFGSRDKFGDDSGCESNDVEVDMNDFNDNIDMDTMWVGGKNCNVVQEENEVGELNEVLNNEFLMSGSSSDEGPVAQRKKTIKAIQRTHENDEANFKERVKLYAIEIRRELDFEKMTKIGGTIPKLGNLDNSEEGQQEVNNEDEEKCMWSLYASKWKHDINWMVKSYNKEHQQLQHDYQVGLSKMKVFRARIEALNQVRGDYVDYVLELQKHNPNTTVKIDVENEPNPKAESRTFKRIYICLGPLKKGFAARRRDFVSLDGAFMKGPYPGQILSAVGIDGNNGTYPLAYTVVESESANSWTWFLTCLGDDLGLGTNSNFTFMTDRKKGVLPAIAKLFPCAEHL
uniref:MULE transposase domain-containing protein n=1 Tax=Lactuca sativa TaxID=4236 RepID=A0A9R1WEF1_LACSA|nr:hypothetical protein LSAT_V11C200072000 [Lactuca sativa]